MPAVSQGWSSLSLQRTSSFGSFDRFRHHSISKTDDSAEVCITQSFTFFSSLSYDSYVKTLGNYCVNFTPVRTLLVYLDLSGQLSTCQNEQENHT